MALTPESPAGITHRSSDPPSCPLQSRRQAGDYRGRGIRAYRMSVHFQVPRQQRENILERRGVHLVDPTVKRSLTLAFTPGTRPSSAMRTTTSVSCGGPSPAPGFFTGSGLAGVRGLPADLIPYRSPSSFASAGNRSWRRAASSSSIFSFSQRFRETSLAGRGERKSGSVSRSVPAGSRKYFTTA